MLDFLVETQYKVIILEWLLDFTADTVGISSTETLQC